LTTIHQVKADVLKALGPGAEVTECRELQRLWAGYGMVYEVAAKRGDGELEKLVVKKVYVLYPMPRGVSAGK